MILFQNFCNWVARSLKPRVVEIWKLAAPQWNCTAGMILSPRSKKYEVKYQILQSKSVRKHGTCRAVWKCRWHVLDGHNRPPLPQGTALVRRIRLRVKHFAFLALEMTYSTCTGGKSPSRFSNPVRASDCTTPAPATPSSGPANVFAHRRGSNTQATLRRRGMATPRHLRFLGRPQRRLVRGRIARHRRRHSRTRASARRWERPRLCPPTVQARGPARVRVRRRMGAVVATASSYTSPRSSAPWPLSASSSRSSSSWSSCAAAAPAPRARGASSTQRWTWPSGRR
ncbi:hypothetical protein B0H14DRAFT_3147044 [Mycena olivaceomarginata]|nr:hypothetical protein B0H14DRAFT_3147044 [Mycena olivaceomarginata]